MTTATIKKQTAVLENIAGELKTIKTQLRKLLILIPEENLKDYKNSSAIRKAYRNATKVFSPK